MVAMLKALRSWAPVLLSLGGTGLVVSWVLLPTYAASFVILSDVEISEARLDLEGQPARQPFQSQAVDRVFAWDTVLARGTRPRPWVEVSWRGPDGRRSSVRQVVVHEDAAPRCIHILRLGPSAEPVSVGPLPNGEPSVIESLCR